MMSGGNIYKILPPNLHLCASLGLTGLACKKIHPKWRFFAILGLRMGLFWGVNGALVVIHLKRCITTTGGTLLSVISAKCAKKQLKTGM